MIVSNTLIDGQNEIILSKNDVAIFVLEDTKYMTIKDLRIYCFPTFKTKLSVTLTALKFIWKN